MVIGTLWHSNLLFGKMWMRLMKFKDASTKYGATTWLGAILASAIITAVMSGIVDHLGARTFADGLVVGLYVWFGFILPTHFSGVLWAHKAIEIFYIEVGCYLATFTTIAAIFATWG